VVASEPVEDELGGMWVAVMEAYVADPSGFVQGGFKLLNRENPVLVPVVVSHSVGMPNPTAAAGWALMYYTILSLTSGQGQSVPVVSQATSEQFLVGMAGVERAKMTSEMEQAFEEVMVYDRETNSGLRAFWFHYFMWRYYTESTRGAQESDISARALLFLANIIHAQRKVLSARRKVPRAN